MHAGRQDCRGPSSPPITRTADVVDDSDDDLARDRVNCGRGSRRSTGGGGGACVHGASRRLPPSPPPPRTADEQRVVHDALCSEEGDVRVQLLLELRALRRREAQLEREVVVFEHRIGDMAPVGSRWAVLDGADLEGLATVAAPHDRAGRAPRRSPPHPRSFEVEALVDGGWEAGREGGRRGGGGGRRNRGDACGQTRQDKPGTRGATLHTPFVGKTFSMTTK